MKHSNTMPHWAILLTCLASSSAFGCGAGDPPVDPSGETGGQGNDTGSGGGVSDPPPDSPSACEASVPGSRLLRRLTRRELLNSQADVFAEAATGATSTLPGDSVDRLRLSNDSAILTMSQDAAQALLDRAEEIADAVTDPAALSNLFPCAASNPDDTCATEFINKYAQELFRRPVTAAETERYLALFQSISGTSDFNTGLKWALVGLIQSPLAVYRTELGEGGKLTPYEIAAELSYDYSASAPSAELVAKALAGELDDPDVRYQEAMKLLDTPRGREVLGQFFEEWLSYRDVLTVARSETPDNFETVRPKMVLETARFLDTLLFDKAGKLPDLLTANFTVADQELASYYGFSGGSADIAQDGGSEVQRDWGLGVFAQGSVTTSMASITITSPTRRGLLLLRRLYCKVPGPPQAINFDLTADQVVGNTTRERIETSHLDASCASCHADFDPLGFGFENIDHVGRYRTEEVTPNGSFPINATATVESLDDLFIDGQEELMVGLAADDEVLACVSSTMARYVYGGDGDCRAKDAQLRVMEGETSIVAYLAELSREPHFTQRN